MSERLNIKKYVVVCIRLNNYQIVLKLEGVSFSFYDSEHPSEIPYHLLLIVTKSKKQVISEVNRNKTTFGLLSMGNSSQCKN